MGEDRKEAEERNDSAAAKSFVREIESAVREFESRSSIEVAVALASQSGSYRELPWFAGTILSWAALAFFIFSPWLFDPWFLILNVPVAFLLGALLAWKVPPVARRLVTAGRLRRQVDAAASSAFFRLNVHATRESWSFTRRKGVMSKGPEEITRLACPSCGAPVELTAEGKCTYCSRVVTGGRFHWTVTNRQVLEKRAREPHEITRGGGEERGADLPTLFQPNFAAEQKGFAARYPDFSWPEFEKRVEHVFLKLQEAWSTKRWELARPYESDCLFQMHRYWIERYKREGLTNRLEKVEVEKLVPCHIEQDAFYESITLRVFAGMLDYTTDKKGSVVVGSNKRRRRFSEYWTFIRRVGFSAESKPAGQCPSCGAPLKINQTGVCEYCESKITTGEFDWVLSAIEQDEVYAG